MVEAPGSEEAAKLQRKQKIKNALMNLKTILKKKEVEIDANAFKLLLFDREDLN